MPTTPVYALPYPASTDPADVPLDMQELAERVEVVLPTVPGLRKIAETILAANAATIDFAAIPQTYSHLRLVANLRCNQATYFQTGYLRINGNSGNNYHVQRMRVGGATVSGIENLNVDGIYITVVGTSNPSLASPLIVEVPGYRDGAIYRAVLTQGTFFGSGGAGGFNIENAYGLFQNGAAVTQLTLALQAGNFIAGSRATLYGLT